MWREELNREFLLVPMKVEALVIGKEAEDAGYTDAAANFRMLEYTSLAKQMQTSPFTYTDPLKKGVHLHWILPEAFTRGTQNEETGEISYPEAPDKWLVIRITARGENRKETEIDTRGFLVESSYVSSVKTGENRYSSPYPVLNQDGHMDYVYLGRSYDLGYGKEQGNHLESLTSFGYGDPSFFAYYQSCRNVFGFYDELEDVTEGEISYMVCGWFGDSGRDPIRRAGEAYQNLLMENRWKQARSSAAENECNAVLCHGSIHGIGWKGREYVYPSGVSEGNPDMAVGNNSIEAVSAMLMKKAGFGNVEERLLYAFLNGTAEDMKEMDGIIRTEQTIHENMFDTVNGEIRWELKEREHDRKEAKAPDLSWETACLLDRLNKEQRKLMEASQHKDRREKEIYFLWYQYTAKIRTEAMEEEEKKRYLDEMRTQLQEWKEQKAEVERQEKHCLQCRKEVLGTKEAKTHYRLTSCPGDKYFVPTEPVLLFSGNGITNLLGGTKAEGKSGSVLCRTASQTIDGIRIEGVEGAALISHAADAIDGWYTYPAIIRRLLGETMIEMPAYARDLAYQLLMAGGIELESEKAKAVFQAIRGFQDGIMQGMTQVSAGTADTPAAGSQPELPLRASVQDGGVLPAPEADSRLDTNYYPLFMDWGVFYYPDEDCLGGEKKLKKWNLQKIDYELAKEIRSGRKSGKYKGKMLLTSHAAENIRAVIGRYEERAEGGIKDALGGMKEKFADTEMLSQRLNGFQEYFLREKQAMHFPLKEIWEEDAEIARIVSQVFGGEEKSRFYERMDDVILTDPYMEGVYSPVRAGFMEIAEIRLVDTFGRVKTICSEDNYELEAKAMAFSENLRKDGEDVRIMLPPRIMLPARIYSEFHSLRSGEIEAADIHCTSPVFGWLIPGYMDGSLSVLSEKGKVLGKYQTFINRKGEAAIKFVSSAKCGMAKTEGRFEIPEGINPKLRQFMVNFRDSMTEGVSRDAGILYDLVNTLLYDIHGMKQHGGISGENPWAMGQPFALAELSLTLETLEDPGKKPDWDRRKEEPSPLETLGFPVLVGDKRRRDDGVVGFFMGEEKEIYKRIYMEKQGSFHAGTYIHNENRLELFWGKKTTITLLFDPLLSIHLISGILPVKKISLSKTVAERELIRLEPQLFVHPLLKGKDGIEIFLPKEDKKEWKYIRLARGIYTAQGTGGTTDTLRWDYPLSLTDGWLQQGEEEAHDTVQSES